MNKIKHNIDLFIGKALIVLETLIAIVSLVVLVVLLGIELWQMFSDPSYLRADNAVTEYLHNILSIVVGLEFVKLLLHLTPANILEVLTMAIARSIIVSHGSAVDNVLSIACIVAMFAARRYLIPRNELHQDMDDTHQPHHRRHKHGKQHQNEEKQETVHN